jgi:hypothetical protein
MVDLSRAGGRRSPTTVEYEPRSVLAPALKYGKAKSKKIETGL